MARNEPQMNFRIPADLKARLEAAAQESGRSLTAEMVLRLQASLAGGGDLEATRQALELAQARIEHHRSIAETCEASSKMVTGLYVNLLEQLPQEQADRVMKPHAREYFSDLARAPRLASEVRRFLSLVESLTPEALSELRQLANEFDQQQPEPDEVFFGARTGAVVPSRRAKASTTGKVDEVARAPARQLSKKKAR